jgi:glycosyltransferase involved in cell wall biosynthesis
VEAAGVRIVLTHPFCWPYVRRGSERQLDALSRYLTSRGHEVFTVSTCPERPGHSEQTEAGVRILHPGVDRPWLTRCRLHASHMFFFGALRSMLRLRPDVVHSLFYVDSAAANLLKRVRRQRTVLQLNGAPVPGAFHQRFPPERWLLRRAIFDADVVSVCSQFVRDLIERDYGVRPRVVTPPIRLEDFPIGDGPPDGVPTIVGAADFTVPQKGLAVLLQAFALVKRDEPRARLRLSGRMDGEACERALASLAPRVRRDVDVLGIGRIDDVSRVLREASVYVLPSMWEASGGTMLEAWASGTPVVATRHGGLPEFMHPDVGFLFDPQTEEKETHNARGLADAIVSVLALSRTAGIRERCRRHAARYSWDVLGPDIESLYSKQ